MDHSLVSVAVLAGAAVVARLTNSLPRVCLLAGVTGVVIGGALAATAGAIGLADAYRGAAPERLHLAWSVPFGSFLVELDALTTFFLLAIGVVAVPAAVFAYEYMPGHAHGRPLGPFFFFLNVFVAGMVLVVLARNGVLFLIAWEVMSLAAYFLITFEDEKPEVRDAGWNYLVATHLGTAFLLVLFVLLGGGSASLDFPDRPLAGAAANVAFVMALVGFGTKAGFVPLHVWLPDAHPAAPSPVSAILSGVMIKTGIYGLLRTFALLPHPPHWWGVALVGIGVVTGLYGIVMANAQKDFKRLLAYSSVENVGVIALGLGAGLLGLSAGRPALAFLGFAGAILHTLNHAAIKTLLFLAAGTVLHCAGTGRIERLGGLMKRLPAVGLAFLVGVVAISALPPLNGFVGEFLIYLGVFQEALTLPSLAAIPALAVVAGLALIGGLTVAGFTKLFGITFLGEPRTDEARDVHRPGPLLVAPVVALAAACVALAALAPLYIPLLGPVVAVAARAPSADVGGVLADSAASWEMVVTMGGVFLAVAGGLALARYLMLRNREVTEAGTWGCGYLGPTPRMQYTGSSYSQPIVDLVGSALGATKEEPVITDYFPTASPTLTTAAPDTPKTRLFAPLYAGIVAALARLRWLHHGRLHIYVLYIAVTLLLLLFLYLGPAP
jgi:hydrogenase-4 component B